MKYNISYKLHLKVIIVSIFFCISCYDFVEYTILDFCINIITHNHISILLLYTYAILTMGLLSIVHELIHGLTYKLLGGKVTYKFRILYLATQEISGKALAIYKFAIVLLAPFIIISLGSLLFPTWISNFLLIVNFISSLADILMTLELIKYPRYSKIIDRDYGYDIIF
ncbi:Protein of uncharacterised function (DUF3267) [Clostridium cochlearium]|nr:Protein of uncharacterised function (DUF3267) [Clostridium cochlearium]STA93144.1 Protein of uncharacterised function (DUF3267) [Clostridium cochlearium]